MAIIFNEQSKTFKLDTSISSYIIKIYEGRYLLNLYYGRNIPENTVEGFDLGAAWSRQAHAKLSRLLLSPKSTQTQRKQKKGGVIATLCD